MSSSVGDSDDAVLRELQRVEGGRTITMGIHNTITGLMCGAQCLDDDQTHGVQRGIPSMLVIESYHDQRTPLTARRVERQKSPSRPAATS